MALTIGMQLGSYEITALLGKGGMGEVYRARDLKLKREVAIKILPDELARDFDRVRRFQREAEVLASLNHPNIAAIHDLVEANGCKYLVLELVEGATLADRIASGTVPVQEALNIALQICEALAAAHEKGIIHRDLKPANIKLKPDGKVKVLDFGLAKAIEEDKAAVPNSNSPTLSALQTAGGVILGTPAYMSPEQARGQQADRRADIWAFGCVLYEMLTARQTFRGATASDVIATLLKQDPDWSLLPGDLSPKVRRVLIRCLQKDVNRRFHDIADARLDLEEATKPDPAPSVVGEKAGEPYGKGIIAALAAAIAVAAAFGLWAGREWAIRKAPPAIEWRGDLLGGSTVAMWPRLSPDGEMLAFEAVVDGQTQVAVMRPRSGNWTILSHEKTKGSVEEMAWSHEGTRIFFSRTADVPRGIFSVPVLGGEERLVLEDAATPQALGDGSLLVVRLNAERGGFQLFHFWPQTGRLDALDAIVEGNGFIGGITRVFPDGREAVFLGRTSTSPAQKALYAIDLTSGRSRRLAPNLPIAELPTTTSLATTPDGQWVLLNIRSGNVDRIVEVPRNGSSVIRPLLILSASTGGLDVGTDGSIYVAQRQRFAEALSYWPSTGKVEHLALPDTADNEFASMILQLPDGRLLFDASAAGRPQLSVIAPGKEAVPFVETEEPTVGPMALLGKDRIAFLIGTPPNRQVAVASLADSRIVRRLDRPNAGSVEALAGSPDGKTLYYAEAGVIWAVPSDGGESRRVHEGNRLAIDPVDQSLIIESFTNDGVKLVRFPRVGGAEQPIPMPSGVRLLHDFSSAAVSSDGRIAIQWAPKDSWFWPSAILDPRSGKILELPVAHEFDMPYPGWGPDGRLVSLALPIRSALWRFSPIAGEQ